jgi:hypothetical protein
LLEQIQPQQRPAVGIVSYLSDHHRLNATSYRGYLVGTVVRPTIVAYNRQKIDERAYPLVSYSGSYRFRAHNLERDQYGNWTADLERLAGVLMHINGRSRTGLMLHQMLDLDVPVTPLELKKADMLSHVLTVHLTLSRKTNQAHDFAPEFVRDLL